MFTTEQKQFFYDFETNTAYIVSFQEETYMIVEKGHDFYELARHLYCGSWNLVNKKYYIKEKFKQTKGVRGLSNHNEAD